MNKHYTIEELKEKVCCKVDEESIKYKLPPLSPIISDDLDELLPLIDNAYKDLVKEKLSKLRRIEGSMYKHSTGTEHDMYFKVEDIEQLFNIKL